MSVAGVKCYLWLHGIWRTIVIPPILEMPVNPSSVLFMSAVAMFSRENRRRDKEVKCMLLCEKGNGHLIIGQPLLVL